MIEPTHTHSANSEVRDYLFHLFESLRIQDDLLEDELFESYDQEACAEIVESVHKFAEAEIAPNYLDASREGCRLREDGTVSVPAPYYRQWELFRELGWGGLGAPPDYGGQGAPYILTQVVQEIFYGADTAFTIFSGFCVPGVYLIHTFGGEELKEKFCPNLVSNEWSASLVMTEPEAGTDVGNIDTRARPIGEGLYTLAGDKIFISAGEHDLADNIVYFVLARVDNAKAGTAGLSCFVVPKVWTESDGSSRPNGIRCARIENKMGLHGCPTAHLQFGATDETLGYLLGDREGVGLTQLMSLMNQARISTGVMAIAIARRAYRYALEHAKVRVQGTSASSGVAAEAVRVPIIEHDDVRKNLLRMKAQTEGCRALALRLAYFNDKKLVLSARGQADGAKRYARLVDMLTPILKAYSSDSGWRTCERAIQVMGGYGYIADYPVSHWCCDIKVLSLWEGTNYIQSADLVRSKMALGRDSRVFADFKGVIAAFLENNGGHMAAEIEQLSRAFEAVCAVHAQLRLWLRGGQMPIIYERATDILELVSELTVGWLLIENADTAAARLDTGDTDDADYYRGKIAIARCYTSDHLATVPARAATLCEARSLVDGYATACY